MFFCFCFVLLFARKHDCIMKLISEFAPRVFLLLVLGVSSAFLGVRFALEMVVKFLALIYCEQGRTLGYPCDDSSCLPVVIEKS